MCFPFLQVLDNSDFLEESWQFWYACFFSRNVTLSKEWGAEENGKHPWEKSAQYPSDTTAEKIDVSKIIKYSDKYKHKYRYKYKNKYSGEQPEASLMMSSLKYK